MFVVCNANNLQAHLSVHNRRCCIYKKNKVFRCLKDLKDKVPSFYRDDTQLFVLVLVKSLNSSKYWVQLCCHPKSTTHWQQTWWDCMTDLHSGCSLWTAPTCKSCKGSVICEVFELLKHTNAELYNWKADHPAYSLVFGSGRAKWCCFLDVCIFTSQSRIQWHHNRGRQKYCWSHAT